MNIKKPVLKYNDDDLDLNFECDITNENPSFSAMDQQINDMKRDIEEYDKDIYRLTSHATLLDYSLSVASGTLAGFLDIIFTKNLDLSSQSSLINGVATEFSGEPISSTKEAINVLNNGLNASSSINNLYLASQASLIGLVFSIIGALTGSKILYTKNDEVKVEHVKPVIDASLFSGVFYGTIAWICHLISSKASLESNIPAGLKNLVFDATNSGLKVKGNDLYQAINNNIDSSSLNAISTGLNTLKLLGSQALVVGINEAVVRAVFFIREFFKEVKQKNIKSVKELGKVDFKKTVPFNSRTVARMISVSLATMMAIDICDASIEAAIKSDGNKALFASNLAIRINFIGVGRIILAVSTELYMAKSLKKKRSERISLVSDYVTLLGRKIYCIQDDVWKGCHKASEVIESVKKVMADTILMASSELDKTKESLENIEKTVDDAFKKNENLKKDIKDILDWE